MISLRRWFSLSGLALIALGALWGLWRMTTSTAECLGPIALWIVGIVLYMRAIRYQKYLKTHAQLLPQDPIGAGASAAPSGGKRKAPLRLGLILIVLLIGLCLLFSFLMW